MPKFQADPPNSQNLRKMPTLTACEQCVKCINGVDQQSLRAGLGTVSAFSAGNKWPENSKGQCVGL